MKGSTPPQIAEIIIKLVKDMAAVRFSCFYSTLLFNCTSNVTLYLILDLESSVALRKLPLTKLCTVFRATFQMLGPESPKMQ